VWDNLNGVIGSKKLTTQRPRHASAQIIDCQVNFICRSHDDAKVCFSSGKGAGSLRLMKE
jgi:hypothetical protein